MTRRAECACRACTIEVEGEPMLNALCHCSNCRRRTGSAFGWSTYFPDHQVGAKTGPLIAYELPSEMNQTRWLCGRCGTTLFWKAGFMAEATGIAAGCFTDPPMPEPTFSSADSQRLCWVALPDSWARRP